MTADDCAAIVEHLPIIEAVANGQYVYFAAFDYTGKFVEWRRTKKILLAPLRSGFYSLKPRYQCIKPGVLKSIPYRSQEEYFAAKATP